MLTFAGMVLMLVAAKNDAAIIPLDSTKTSAVGEDETISWTYDNASDMETVDWDFKSSSSQTPTTIMSKAGAAAATVFNNFSVEHVSDGIITLKKVTLENDGIYYCTVTYILGLGHASVTGTVTLSVIEATSPAALDCCCCLIDCKDMKIGACYFLNIIIYIIIFVVFSIIVGIVVEAIFNIWGIMSLKWRIVSLAFFFFGFGLFICYSGRKKTLRYFVITSNGTPINMDESLNQVASIGAYFVTKITPGGPADGKLKVGDKILKIDEVDVKRKDHNEIDTMMKGKSNINLQISKDGRDDTSSVALHYKEGELLGFEFGISAIVTHVIKCSKAHGKPKVGDLIMSDMKEMLPFSSVLNENRGKPKRSHHYHKQGPIEMDSTERGVSDLGRERSGSIVSGRDVEMQETDNSFNKSQLPDIQDKKFRGVSANFTDGHHPLANIDIPAKKAGALESIPDSAREEVTKKKKKKKKRRVETEDD